MTTIPRHPLFYSKEYTPTSDVEWHRIQTVLIGESGYLLDFLYYDHPVKILIKKDRTEVSFPLNRSYPPDPYTSLWLCTKEEYDNRDRNPSSTWRLDDYGYEVNCSYSLDLNLEEEFLFVGFYISV